MQKLILFVFICLFFFEGCTHVPLKEITIENIPLQKKQFNVYTIDSTYLLNPSGIYCYGEHILIVDGGNNPFLTFWQPDNLAYEFSAGYKGNGPNEFINPRSNYFAASDSSFFILDSNIEWEIQLDKDSMHIINKEPIVIPDAINQLVHLDNGLYVMAGYTDGGNDGEHFLYDKNTGAFESFGEYLSSDVADERKFAFDYKNTVGKTEKSCIWDFYVYHNLIRQYSLKGHLLQEMRLAGIRERNNSDYKSLDLKNQPFWDRVIATDDWIYALFYEGITEATLYAEGAIPELQIWDWNGNLRKRIQFDRIYNQIAVSDEGVLYAMSTIEPFNYQVYKYELE